MNAYVGIRIKKRRESLGLSQTDLSKMTGLSQGQISRYEGGANEPSAEYLVWIARSLECSADYLLGLTDEIKPILSVSELERGEIELLNLFRSKTPENRNVILNVAKSLS